MRQKNHIDSTAIILESISDGVFTTDCEGRITSFNRAAEEITGTSRKEAVGKRCWEVFRASMCEDDCALKRTMKTGEPIIDKSAFIVRSDGRRIPISVSTALLRNENGKIIGGAETFRDLSIVYELRKELEGRFRVGDLVSRSESMREIFEVVPLMAASDSTLFIQGETGTGKELLARAVHNLSPRSKGPFVAVNCGALPDTLLESELFGYVPGAFTGANKTKPGRFAMAEGGTLFLDEIGEVSPALQVRLLRVLQEKIYEPLGSAKSHAADVRIVTATNRNLEERVKEDKFRQDLYYRINVVRIDLPPLRERKEDIPLLVDHFVERFNRLQERAVKGVETDVMALLMAHDWPGNIRELENIIEHAFVLCSKDRIRSVHLPGALLPKVSVPHGPVRINQTVKAIESQAILDALNRNSGNRSATARELGIHKSTLYRKIKSHGIILPEDDGRSHISVSTPASEQE